MLRPEDFGVFVTPFIIYSLARTLQDFGTLKTIFIGNNQDPFLLKELFGFNIISTLLIGSILVFFAPGFVKLWTSSDTSSGIMFYLGISFYFTVPQLVFENYLRKNMQFKKLFFINFLITTLSVLIGVASAYHYGDHTALLLKHFVYVGMGMLLFTITLNEFVRPVFIFKNLKKYKSFSLSLILSDVLGYISRNADNLLIDKFLGIKALGVYERAYKFLRLPNEQLSGAINRVLLPTYSKLNNFPDQQFKLLKLSVLVVFVIICPVSCLFFIYTNEIVLHIFGQQWMDLVPLLKIFSILILFQSISPFFGNLFIVNGNTKPLLYFSLVSQPIYLIIFVYFTMINPDIVALSTMYTISSIIFSLFFWQMGCSLLKVNLIHFLKIFRIQILIALSLFILFTFIKDIIFVNYSTVLGFILVFAVTILYFIVSFFSNHELKAVVLKVFKSLD